MKTDTSVARQVAAVAIGNALEWYDFGIYGYVAVTISKLFFPPETGWAPLLATFGLFAVAYFVRPVGGVVLGYYADRFGRMTQLVMIMWLMAAGSALVAIAPTYKTAGAAAPLIVLVARLVQGISAGGEFSGATAFLVEHASPQRRGFYGAWQFSGQGAAVLLSGLIGLLITHGLSNGELESWGWRLPFAVGAIVGPLGAYIRLKATEPAEFLVGRLSHREGTSVPKMLVVEGRGILIGLALVVGGTAAFYVLFVFLPAYAVKMLKIGLTGSFVAPLVAGAAVMVCAPIMGWLSDRVGRRRIMMLAVLGFLAGVYPGFVWLQAMRSASALALVEFAFGVLFAAYAGPFGAAMAELFPVHARATAMAIAYNVGVALFGGGAPLIVAWLIARTGNPFAPAFYVIGALFLSVIAVYAMPNSGMATSCVATRASLRRRQD